MKYANDAYSIRCKGIVLHVTFSEHKGTHLDNDGL